METSRNLDAAKQGASSAQWQARRGLGCAGSALRRGMSAQAEWWLWRRRHPDSIERSHRGP